MNKTIRKLVIVGGGTAGWMTASALSKVLGSALYDITLVESEEIGTVGVGEATIPMIILFNELLGINEDEFIRETNATFKLGIHFVDWGSEGSDYIHPFGLFGTDMDGIPFGHFLLRHRALSGQSDFGPYNAETMAIRAGKFGRTLKTDAANLPRVNYAFQFDAGMYAAFLRRYAEARGVVRREGRIVKVNQDAQSGDVTSVQLADGGTVEGDLFIDCSGFRGLLIEETLKTGYEDWSEWLPANRAAAVPTMKAQLPEGGDAHLTPYTRATAREAGWQWRIPLQHRTGNGYVFSSEFISEDEAVEKLLTRLDGKPLKDPKVLRFVTGRRKKTWNKNVVALGLASGFLEPLESTSIHLVQVGIAKLLAFFPKDGINPHVVEQYNREMAFDYINVKDFLIAHYHVTQREGSPFWKYVKNMRIPDSLQARLEIFKQTGQIGTANNELFKEVSWFAVLTGQGLMPQGYHPVADVLSGDELTQRMAQVRKGVATRVAGLMSHEGYIDKHCKSPPMAM